MSPQEYKKYIEGAVRYVLQQKLQGVITQRAFRKWESDNIRLTYEERKRISGRVKHRERVSRMAA